MSATPKATMQERRHQLLVDVAELVATAVQDLGVTPDVAEHAGHVVADYLTEHWAGQQVNFPVKDGYGLSPRERAIAADAAQGMPIYKLASKYHMGERGIRKLLARLTTRGQIQPPIGQRDLFS